MGDIHLADRPPSIRTEHYAEQVLDKLEQTVAIAKAENVDAVIWVGDVFHVKAPTRTSHSLVQRLVDLGQSYERQWIIVPGNHDLTNDRMESLARQPLGVLYKAGAELGDGEHRIYGNPPQTTGIGSVFCLPWLKDWKTYLQNYMAHWEQSESPLMVTHAAILPPGASAPYEFYDAMDWATMMRREGHVFYGHIHDNHGIYSVRYTDDPDIFETHSLTFCNLGAISRGSLHESTLKRKPHVALYDSDASEPFTPVPLKHLPADEVFRLDIKAADDDRVEKLGKFLESVENTELEGLSVEAVMAHIETLDLSDLTRTLIHECLEEAMSK